MIKDAIRKEVMKRIVRSKSFKNEAVVAILQEGTHAVSHVSVELTKQCPLGNEGELIVLPIDATILPEVIATGGWETEIVSIFASKIRDASERFGAGRLIDVGANCGLATRQLFHLCPGALRDALCIEPHPRNFGCLERNLKGFPVRLENIALGDENGVKSFYEDKYNHGNYSLVKSSVPGGVRTTTQVNVRNVSDFFLQFDESIDPIYWKSDTQGYDQLIVSLVPDHVWSTVCVALIEIRPLSLGPKVDESRFISKFDQFDLEIFGKGTVSLDDFRGILRSKAINQEDLIAVRR